ncbi:MAG: aminotransferase class I/II-fold pyridoxal phosphate-dependent enzyme, partial [Erysipelotrichia bacterium]|nr:aminotransferase class I/II-fold pyridoxal phosphate-dependent enzyme [Erysipelotrichia bacterium]
SFVHTSIDCCSLVDKLVEGNTSFLSLIIFSTSKLLGTYGLRMGALIALLNNRAEHEALGASFMAIARGTYSVPVSAAQVAVAKIFNDPEKVTQLRSEIKVLSERLHKRNQLLIKCLKDCHLDYYPYVSGFFITLKVKDAFKLTAQLEKEHMYVVPINKQSIRLALSGLTENEIVTLVKRISELQS